MAKTKTIRKAVPGSIAETVLARESALAQFSNFVFAARMANAKGMTAAEEYWKAQAVIAFQKR